jgi:hypothetical protein
MSNDDANSGVAADTLVGASVAASAIMTLQSNAAVATYAPLGENSTDLHWSVCSGIE